MRILVPVLLALGLIAGHAPNSLAAPAAPAKLPVVTSFTVLADLIRQVGGDKVQVASLVPAGAEPHTYQPTPEDMKAAAQARLVFYNGAHLEEWWSQFIRSVNPDVPVVELSKGLPALRMSGVPMAGGHAGEEPNPHFWLDVMNAKIYVERIRDTLSRVDPADAAYYARRAETYLAHLDSLDAWIRAQVATIPPARRKLVTFHDAFPYFAKRYGFSISGYVVASPGKEASARELIDLIRRIRKERVPAVFAEAELNPKIMQILARDAGVKVVTNLYIGSLGRGAEVNSYIALMRHDVTEIVNALK
jgi:ABC-type Zn uptake system ZnuABC Zn-binding protein ZnuA